MDVKSGVEEKRVKSTIIRRRSKAEEVPALGTVDELAAVSPPPAADSADAAAPATVEKRPARMTAEVVAGPRGRASTASEGLPTPVAPPRPQGQMAQVISRPADAKKPVAVGVAPAPETSGEAADKDRGVKKLAHRKSRDELEMEMIERAGGLRKAAELMESAPERLERVFRPGKNSKKKKVITRRDFKKTEITTPKAIKRIIRIEGGIPVVELAKRMSLKATDVMKKLFDLGMMATINQTIDVDTAILVAHDFDYEVENVAFAEESVIDGTPEAIDAADRSTRSPIVTVMGHVDHGKTSLLDAIRKTQVAAGEAGGITQHIGAYDVQSAKGSVTFIDTPGHEAFTAMRARGAQVTDLVILVVAADDGIMPQTVEAINHARAAKVPIIVAVNKVDKPSADIGRVERGLMEHGLVSEKLGGDTIIVPVSAKTGQGVDDLLEMISLQSEVLELKANPNKRAIGTIIEARLDKGLGPVVTVVVQDGSLKVGDIVVAGTAAGKVRALIDAQGQNVKEAGPSKPVEVLGLDTVPMAGDKLHAMESEEDARLVSEHREKKSREVKFASQGVMPTKLEDIYAKAAQGEVPDVRVIIKGDVRGSIEALREAVKKLSTDRVRVSVIHTGVGAVSESDVMLAMASNAIVVGFNVRPDAKARETAERNQVQIRSYSIIYEVLDDMKKAMEGLLAPTYEEKYLGRAEVRQVFTVSKIGTIAGCSVTDGKIVRSASVRLLRDGKVMSQGKVSSLKRFKDDAKEVASGLECGIGIENYNDIKLGDVIEAFQIEEIAGKL